MDTPIANLPRARCRVLHWTDSSGQLRATVSGKLVFELTQRELVTPKVGPEFDWDAHEHAVFKPCVDVVVVGAARAGLVSLGVARDGRVVLQKRRLCDAERGAWLTLETGTEAGGFAPRPRVTPTGSGSAADPFRFDAACDASAFQCAPPDQRLADFHFGELLLLRGFFDGAPRLFRFPRTEPYAIVEIAGAPPTRLRLTVDTLTIDVGASTVALVARAAVPPRLWSGENAAEISATLALAPTPSRGRTFRMPKAWSDALDRRHLPLPTEETLEIVAPPDVGIAKLTSFVDRTTSETVLVVKESFAIVDGALGAKTDPAAIEYDRRTDGAEGELVAANELTPLRESVDVLIRATAHAPPTATHALVRVEVDGRELRLVALPPRAWRGDALVATGPFSPVPLTWSRAFGGPDLPENPIGTGYRGLGAPPLVEDPHRLLRHKDDVVRPVGLAPIDPLWSERRARSGTADRAWSETRFPALPADAHRDVHQAAPAPLRMPRPADRSPGHPIATVKISGVRPDGGEIDLALPPCDVAVLHQRGSEDPRALGLTLDGVTVDTDALRIDLVWKTSWPNARPRCWERVLVEPAPREGAVPETARFHLAFDDAWAPDVEPLEERRVPLEHIDAARPTPSETPELDDATTKNEADLRRAIATGRPLRGRNFANASLERADLRGLDLAGIDFTGANLAGANLAGANLAGADLSHAIAAGACFDDARLGRTSLAFASLRGARFANAEADRATFDGARLDDAHLVGLRGARATFVAASLTRAKLDGALLDHADLSEASAEQASFVRANLTDAKLYEAKLAGASFEDAVAVHARFDHADATHARLARVDATDASMAGTKLGGADLRGAKLDGAVLAGADLERVRADGVSAERAIFAGANLASASLRHASFRGASLADAVLDGAAL
ncbi:MAG TPA: DUF2169 domain-containing protein, partial [Polyangiaceae bacterium]|nr:DUF2169 domain-containing protein [Polyangiaceae bacterium]